MWTPADHEAAYRREAFGRTLAATLDSVTEWDAVQAALRQQRDATCAECLRPGGLNRAGWVGCKHEPREFMWGASPCAEHAERQRVRIPK